MYFTRIKTLLFVLYLFCGINLLLAQPVKIKVTLSDELNNESRWVYLFSSIENSMVFEDSVFVTAGQKEFYFNKEIIGLGDGFGGCELLFSGEKPFKVNFSPLPGEFILINLTTIKELNSTLNYVKAEGSPSSIEMHNWFFNMLPIREIILNLRDSLKNTSDETIALQLKDSIAYWVNYLYKGYWLDAVSKAETPIGSIAALLMLKGKISGEKIDSLYMELKQRFPNNKIIENAFTPHPKMTEEENQTSMQNMNRRREILKLQGLFKNDNKPVAPDAKLKEELEKIVSYKTGDTIKNITLKGLNGDLLSVFDETTPYVLIDFWASWCGPCRGEIPGLKETMEKHKGLFSVYAISIDDDEKPWKSAIENDKTEVFTHVNAGMKEKEGQIITKQFGVSAIPANFLIDKNHKIIAINLFGKNLEKTISELQNKN